MAKNVYPLSTVSSQLNSILLEMFNEYGDKISEKAYGVTEKIAQDFAEQLKTVTPRSNSNTEHTADTVVVSKRDKVTYGKKHSVLYVHYRKWQLTHLLEFGWTAKNGRRVTRTPFVRPLFDNNKERYYNMYKEALNNG